MSFNNAELPIVENKLPITKPLIEMKIGNFAQKLNGELSSLAPASTKSIAYNTATNILVHWKRKGLIRDYDVIGNLNEKPDYTLILNGARNEEASLFAAFVTGATFFLFPSSSTLEFDLDLELQNNNDGKIYKCKVKDSVTIWQHIIFFPAFPVFWVGSFNMFTDMSMYSFNEFYKQGTFSRFYKKELKTSQ